MSNNDNDLTMRKAAGLPFDAHGQAALLLVESLIHGLCENAVFTAGQAVEIAERAAGVQSDLADAADGAGETMWRSHALLMTIVESKNR